MGFPSDSCQGISKGEEGMERRYLAGGWTNEGRSPGSADFPSAQTVLKEIAMMLMSACHEHDLVLFEIETAIETGYPFPDLVGDRRDPLLQREIVGNVNDSGIKEARMVLRDCLCAHIGHS
jgi:hypothetical protein